MSLIINNFYALKSPTRHLRRVYCKDLLINLLNNMSKMPNEILREDLPLISFSQSRYSPPKLNG